MYFSPGLPVISPIDIPCFEYGWPSSSTRANVVFVVTSALLPVVNAAVIGVELLPSLPKPPSSVVAPALTAMPTFEESATVITVSKFHPSIASNVNVSVSLSYTGSPSYAGSAVITASSKSTSSCELQLITIWSPTTAFATVGLPKPSSPVTVTFLNP
ncbi:MAG: hypothetical protein MJ219_03800 [Mycoplasmoidaceae bacterium]|nr:hypothetical protein [Mycoplasmoidaceae bacterium]